MEKFRKYEIECPQCSERQETELCQSIDAARDPDLRDDLLQNRFNICECPQCQYRFRIDAPVFYRDPDRGESIICIPNEGPARSEQESGPETIVRELQQSSPEMGPSESLQLVCSHSELVERIFLLDARMDARIIEYIKYLMHTRNPEQLDPARKRLLFNAEQSGPEKLLFIVQDIDTKKLEGVLEYNREAYDAFVELFDQDELTPDLLELFPGPYIDARDCLLRESGV